MAAERQQLSLVRAEGPSPRRAVALAVAFASALLVASCSSNGDVREAEEEGSAPETPAQAPAAFDFDLEFTGNEKISGDTIRDALADEIASAGEEGWRKADVDDVAYEVERLYRRRGYHFASVDYTYTEGGATIEIEEGPRVVLAQLVFEGNAAFTSEQLREILGTDDAGLFDFGDPIYVESEVEGFQGRIEDLYFERGYQEVVVHEPSTEFIRDRRAAVVTVKIEQGPQYVLQEIRPGYLPHVSHDEVTQSLQYLIGSAYVPRIRFEVRTAIEEMYADLGYPDARAAVTVSTLDESGEEAGRKRVGIRLTVDARPGPKVVIASVRVEGEEEVDESFIRSRILLEAGDTYSGQVERRSFRRLLATGLFRSVDIHLRELDEAPEAPRGADARDVEHRDLVIEVEEAESVEYFFEIGWGSYDLLRGKAGVRERNLFGQAVIGRAEVLGSFRGAQGTVGLTAPWFLQSEWSADLPVSILYREEPAFTILEGSSGLRLSRPITEHLKGGVGYRFSLSEITDFETSQFTDEPNLRLGAAGPFLDYDSRDDVFAPTSGTRARVFGEVGTPFLGGEISFLHGGVSLSHFVRIFEGTVLAGRADTEWIVPFDDTQDIPLQERLFNGGENTVRSFEQDELGPSDPQGTPVGGEVRNLVSLELRQRVIENFSIAIFGDYGNVALTDENPLEGFRPAVGFGVRYSLPIGPIRLDTAFNPEHRDDEDLYEIHFAVGMPF